jgi:lipoprotein-anchoring transpeptidase ErfK/SrfK
MDGSHRTRSAGQRRRRPGVHTDVLGPRHAAAQRSAGSHAPPPRTSPGGSHSRFTPSQARRRTAARERMLERRRRSLGALSLLVLAVTVVITLTRPGPQQAAAASRTVTQDVPVAVYASQVDADVPAGAASSGASAAELTQPAGRSFALTEQPRTWTQPAGARIHCPVTVTACVDLRAKITWLQHGTKIILGPVRMQPGEGASRTPRGTFTINKKAAVYYSHTYGGAMPYSVFWGHDGIAYHEGSLTGFSHGCIHLTMANAKRVYAALHKGDRVYVA